MKIRVIIGLAWLCLIACQESADTDQAATEVAEPTGVVTERTVTVTINQGTNMALDVAADGSRVISLQGQLFLLQPDKRAVALTDPYYDAREPQVAGDGSVVFHGYRNGNWDIWRTDVDGAEPTALTDDVFDDREPQLSADSSKLVYASDRGGSYDVWQLAYAYSEAGMSSLMVDQQAVVSHRGAISGVQWSPDGERLSYQLLGAEGAQMRVIGADGEGGEVVSRPGSDVFPFRASWLDESVLSYVADGVIVRQTLGESAAEWPFAVQLTLTRHDYPRRVRDYDGERIRAALGISNPVINSDGSTVYFSALGDIWRWQAEANSLTQITDTPAAEFGLALHNDDNQLAYISDIGGRLQLMVRYLDSGEARAVPIEANQISFPSWSPDGKNLAFFVDVPGNPLGGQLTVMELATGDTVRLLLPMPAQPISWSADGEHVAVTRLSPYSSRYREGIYELVVTGRDGGEKHTIVPVAHKSITDATLQPDGSMSYVQGGYLHRLELDDELQPVEGAGQLTDELTDWPKFSSNGEHLVYLAADKLRYKNMATEQVRDITPTIPWRMAEPKERYVVRAGRLFVGHGDGYLVNQDIVVQGAEIVHIGGAGPV